VIASQLAEPGVDGPAAAQAPAGTEGRHEVGDTGKRFWHVVRRLMGDRSRQEVLLTVERHIPRPKLAWSGAIRNDSRAGAHPMSSGGL
jgi:hypothetical protein